MALEQLRQLQIDLRDSYRQLFDRVEKVAHGMAIVQRAQWRSETADATIRVEHEWARVGRLALGHELSLVRIYDGGYGVTQVVMGYGTGRIIGVARGVESADATLSWRPGIPAARGEQPTVDDYQMTIREFLRGVAYLEQD